METNIKDLQTKIYHAVKEFRNLADVEDVLLRKAYGEYQKVCDNQFVVSANELLAKYELLFGIVADPVNESLDFRRARIINRLSTSPPYTYQFLCDRLAAMSDDYTIESDFDNYRMHISVHLRGYGEFEELARLLWSIIPCNIEFTTTNSLSSEADLPMFIGGAVTVMSKTYLKCEAGG